MKFREMAVTPKQAAKWLEKNASNRGLSDKRVNAYARDMASGAWHLMPHGLVFNVSGDLLDGQHRLHAVIRAEKPVKMVVITGADHEVRAYIDKARPRTIADTLRMHGAKFANRKASIARWLRHMDADDLSSRDLMTLTEAEETLARHADAVAWLDSAPLERGFYRAPYLAAVLWCLPISPVVEQFHEKVQTGAGLAPDEPAMAMRQWFIRSHARAQGGGTASEDGLLRTLNCIHAAIVGEPVTRLFASTVGYRALAEMRGGGNEKLAAKRTRRSGSSS